uniref:RRM domain-containing protein n=1 Tax=Ananas comosus var. bracteatus TaxID=296719 RepID=A0A6V7QLJ1_ANACO|nr:unnamed protein product [Ananas comosus var. bracteatus]
MDQRLKQQQQAMMQQAMLLQQQQQLFLSQMEPVPSGNLPPGFDTSTCRSVYVGNIHPSVTESLLVEVFQSVGPLEACKLIRKEKSSFGFVDYLDRRSAALAITTLHGRQIYGQAIKVNWAYASGHREDTSGHFQIFVGDLSHEVTDATLFDFFSAYPNCSDARVMWDKKNERSRGFGFVSFRNQEDAQNAINEMTGKWLGSRQIRCNWAIANSGEDKQDSDNPNAVVLTNGNSGRVEKEPKNLNGESPENNPAYTTVYVGNLAHEVTQAELHRQFHILGAGVIEEVRIQRDKGFGFVRYRTHEEAALAIQLANGKIVSGKSMKCSWGTKPTPPGTVSNPLPPPVSPFQLLPAGYTATELLAYQRQLALSQAAAASGAMAGLLSSGSQAMYNGYPSSSSAQQHLYYN